MVVVVAEFWGWVTVGEAEPAPEGEALPRDRCQPCWDAAAAPEK